VRRDPRPSTSQRDGVTRQAKRLCALRRSGCLFFKSVRESEVDHIYGQPLFIASPRLITSPPHLLIASSPHRLISSSPVHLFTASLLHPLIFMTRVTPKHD